MKPLAGGYEEGYSEIELSFSRLEKQLRMVEEELMAADARIYDLEASAQAAIDLLKNDKYSTRVRNALIELEDVMDEDRRHNNLEDL